MRKSLKRAVLVFLSLHSAVIIMLVFMALQSGMIPGIPLLTIIIAVSAAGLTLYTADMIAGIVNEEIARHTKTYAQLSARFQTESEALDRKARELECLAATMQEYRRSIEDSASIINGYSEQITQLVASVESSDSNSESVSGAPD